MEETLPMGNVRRSRFWLYTPITLLLLVAVAWSVAWFLIRSRAEEAINAWLAAEARTGREWTCQNRQIGGYPFRIEVTCDALGLKQGAVDVAFGRTEAVAQVYQPRLVVADIDGPLRVSDGSTTVQGSWSLMQASVHATPTGLQRLSIVADDPSVTVTGLTPDPVATSGKRLELHVRPNPSRTQEKAYDAAAIIRQARLPVVDNLVGGTEPVDLNADVTATEAEGFKGRPIVQELERWRKAGGRLDILMLSLAKGPRRMEAKGDLRLDEAHRLTGQLNVAAAGLDGLIGNLTGNRAGGALLGALLGQGPRAASNQGSGPSLSPLPPLRLDNGFLAMGPFVIPNLRLKPLY